ncbi:MAG: hypothetical protein AABM42_10840 [Actinomycetota bacterium]
MLVRARGAIDPRQQRILFYLYTPDLTALRESLGAQGVAVGPIVDGSPGPEREMSLCDPDGYCLMVAEADVA